MEIGGETYTKAKPALELVLSTTRVKCPAGHTSAATVPAPTCWPPA